MSDGGLVYALLLQRCLRTEIPFVCENVQLVQVVRVVSAEMHSFFKRNLSYASIMKLGAK